MFNMINGSHNLNLIVDDDLDSLIFYHPRLRLNKTDGEDIYHIDIIGNSAEIGILLLRSQLN